MIKVIFAVVFAALISSSLSYASENSPINPLTKQSFCFIQDSNEVSSKTQVANNGAGAGSVICCCYGNCKAMPSCLSCPMGCICPATDWMKQ